MEVVAYAELHLAIYRNAGMCKKALYVLHFHQNVCRSPKSLSVYPKPQSAHTIIEGSLAALLDLFERL